MKRWKKVWEREERARLEAEGMEVEEGLLQGPGLSPKPLREAEG